MADTMTMDLYSLPSSPPNFDKIGVFYIAFCATWTTVVLAGMIFLIFHRRNPIVRVRGLPLSLASITLLHCYWILANLTYPIGRTMPVVIAYSVQYFIMGIFFPLGIALFQAANARFFHVAKMQRQFTHFKSGSRAGGGTGCNGADSSWLCRLSNMDYIKRVLIYIGCGMVIQTLLTIGMWLACTKYHPAFGLPGTELHGSLQEQFIEMGRGWEWWPSVLWQVIWTWIVAPILLWKSWGIHDTLGWRIQTVGCCISSLHATPMFLIATYVPAFAPVNMYFAPSYWIHLSTMMFEVFTIFVPCYQVARHRSLHRQASASNAKWETSSQTTLRGSMYHEWSSSSIADKGKTEVVHRDSADRLLTMSALNYMLEHNPDPLQDFSALRDFSGENIAFLTTISAWKSSWPENQDADGERVRDAFNRALAIYTDFIGPRDAEFPLNLSWSDLKELEAIFEKPARIICGEARVNPAIPFIVDVFFPDRVVAPSEEPERLELREVASRLQYTGEIPAGFDGAVFDKAQTHIKYLVLTNTWPKFVNEERQRRLSGETDWSERSGLSHMTPTRRLSNYIRRIF